jgi:tetratricopeptide (TPR) repeat protein/tRNA A-37 threonylcarbamoyl transferase component Bud32
MASDTPSPDDTARDFTTTFSSGLAGASEGFGMRADAPAKDQLLGEDLGGVTILRIIADGGMGRVYEGLQHKPRRTVAVKVIRSGIITPALMKRFEYESQVLASLTHPGIAQIHSVGLQTVAGTVVPYFVMELIPDAKSLVDFASDHSLPTHARVALFRKVSEAVAYGHQKGIIHRDLKPGNILVGADGTPKVIDFGVARSTDADRALTTMHTDVGQLIGTLQYMSPEQFAVEPDELDVRADVYAMGVVLYELLAGRPPYDVAHKGVFEVARVVRDVDPAPLSSVNKTLRRDLATIVHKCLEKDRTRRYSSAAELAADMGRYLVGDPITAAPMGLMDGVARLARRHRIAAAAAATAFLALVISTLAVTTFAVRAERERTLAVASRREAMLNAAEARSNEQRAVAERDRASEQEALARKEKNRTQRLFDFLMESMRGADPYSGRRDMTVLEMLRTAGTRAPQHFRDDPRLQGDMLQTVGQVLQFSGDYATARPILEEAVNLWRKEIAAGGVEDRDRLAGALHALGSLYRGLREYDRAAPLLEQSLAIAEEMFGEEDVRTAGILGDVAALRHERGDAKTAESLHRRQLAIYRDAYGENHELPAGALTAVGCTIASQGRLKEAERFFRRALEVYESLFEGMHPRIATTTLHLGATLRLQHRLEEARPLLERALDMCERTLGAEHDVTSEVLMHIGMMSAGEGRHDEASHAFERVVALREKLFGPDSRHLHTPLLLLASEYMALDRPEDAARMRTRAQALDDVSPRVP